MERVEKLRNEFAAHTAGLSPQCADVQNDQSDGAASGSSSTDTRRHLSNLKDQSALYVARASPMPEPTANAFRSVRTKIEFGEAGVKKRAKWRAKQSLLDGHSTVFDLVG